MPQHFFLGMEITAPWPNVWPEGHLIEEQQRHLTIAYLGHLLPEDFLSHSVSFPKPLLEIALAAHFDQPLFLPTRSPHAAAWHVLWYQPEHWASLYQRVLAWLIQSGLSVPQKDPLPHVTLARTPFQCKAWEAAFSPLPLYAGTIHLYESLGHSHSKIHWSYPLLAPFEELEHTADRAFLVRGHTWSEIYLHAQLAMSFLSPTYLPFLQMLSLESEDAVIFALNQRITAMDIAEGSPFKAVSLHGGSRFIQALSPLLEWEMILDV